MSKPYTVESEIEIPFPPEVVRDVFFDFAHFPEIKSSLVRDIKRRPDATGPITKGEILDVDFGIKSTVVVTEISDSELVWRGDVFYILSGLHTFRFEPSKLTAGHTTFVNSEVPLRANAVLMRLFPVKKMYAELNEGLKARVLAVMEKGKGEGEANGNGDAGVGV